jgi:rhodanese-related sulfurtransferase
MDSRAETGLGRLRPERWLLASLSVLGLACAPRATLEPAKDPRVERLVIDVRSPQEFAAGHVAGALNLQLEWEQLEHRAHSYVPDLATPIAVRAAAREAGERAAEILRELGYQDVALPDGRAETAGLGLLTAEDLRVALAGSDPPVVLDVRTHAEWSRGVIPGALTIEQDEGPAAIASLDPTRRYAVICAGGVRSSQLASWMLHEGFADVTNVIDGMRAYYELPGARIEPPRR